MLNIKTQGRTSISYVLTELAAAISLFPVLDFSADSARIHAGLYASLRQRGELIGAHDLIIAATALQHGFAVLTGNEREFNRIPGLNVIAFEA